METKGYRICNIKVARITDDEGFELTLDPRLQLGQTVVGHEILLRCSGKKGMTAYIDSGLRSCEFSQNTANLKFGDDGSFFFMSNDCRISAQLDDKIIGNVDVFPIDGKAEVTLILKEPPNVVPPANADSGTHKYNTILKPWISVIVFVIVLIWMSAMWDKLATNPWLATVLILGEIALLFGGMVSLGVINIKK